MRKIESCLFFLLIITLPTIGQIRTDTIIRTEIYKSYFCYSLKEPLYVTYPLFRGGGDCDRKKQNFYFRSSDPQTASDKDYVGSRYDKGHLANAEDFAYDCYKEEKTFYYYNCAPQTVKLNRGIWKTWEGKLRALSQRNRLFVIAGCIYGSEKLGPQRIGVPQSFYKIVLNANTKQLLYCLLFPNDNSRKVSSIPLSELKRKLGYDLLP